MDQKKSNFAGDGPSSFGAMFLWLVGVIIFYGIISLVAFQWSEIVHFFKGLFGAV